MIGDLFISIVVWFVNSLIGILPTSSGFGPEVFDAFRSIGGYRDIFSPIVPWATLGITIGIIFGTEMAIFGFKTFKWVAGHVPFIGGKGV